MSNLIPMNDLKEMAIAMGAGKLFGKTKEEILALMLIAQAEGKHPAIAAQEYHIIKGTPALKADAIQSRFQLSGGKIQWLKRTDQEVSALFSHPQGGELEVTWTIEMAKAAGLIGKDNWRQYPRAMLAARVKSEGVRALFPSCLSGMYSVEEVMDMDDRDDKEPVPAENQQTVKESYQGHQEEPTQQAEEGQDIKELQAEVFALLKEHGKFTNDPTGYTNFERETIQTNELFSKGKNKQDRNCFELLKGRVLYYAKYRNTPLQEWALEQIHKSGNEIPTAEAEIPDDVLEIDPSTTRVE